MTLNEKILEIIEIASHAVQLEDQGADSIEVDKVLGEIDIALREARGMIDAEWRKSRITVFNKCPKQFDYGESKEFISHLDLEELGL